MNLMGRCSVQLPQMPCRGLLIGIGYPIQQCLLKRAPMQHQDDGECIPHADKRDV